MSPFRKNKASHVVFLVVPVVVDHLRHLTMVLTSAGAFHLNNFFSSERLHSRSVSKGIWLLDYPTLNNFIVVNNVLILLLVNTVPKKFFPRSTIFR